MADTTVVLRHAGRTPVVSRGNVSEYEHTAWPYLFALAPMYALGAYVQAKKLVYKALGLRVHTNSVFVDGVSINSRRMKEGAARWPALNTCYNFTEGHGPSVLHRTLDTWWMNIRNAQAVRNRLKIAKRELHVAVRGFAVPGRPVRILSLAAGTAQGVIEVAAECNALGIATEIMLIDQDLTALGYAKELARKHNVQINTVQGNVVFFTRFVGEFKADIVEMMGLIDYLRDGLAIPLLRKIRLHLGRGGTLFTCHIHPNGESYFLKHVVDWDNGMLYRTREAFEDLLIDSGFLAPRLLTEPHGIHSIAIAVKE